MTLLNIKNTVYENDIKNYKCSDIYDDNFHRALTHMNKNITHIKPVIESEIKQYKIDKIKRIEPYHDMYDMHIKLKSNFISQKVKIDNSNNIEKSDRKSVV